MHLTDGEELKGEVHKEIMKQVEEESLKHVFAGRSLPNAKGTDAHTLSNVKVSWQ